MSIFVLYLCKKDKDEGTKVPSFYNHMISKKKVEEFIDERIAELDNGLFVVELRYLCKRM
jgi:hypothetical protein